MNPEITTYTEQAAAGAPETRLSLSELRTLLREAAAYERAANPAPVVVHTAPQPATAPQTAPAGARVFVPMPPAAAFTPVAVDRPRNIFPLLFMVSGCTGLGSATAAIATGNEGAVAVTIAALIAWGIATYQLVFER